MSQVMNVTDAKARLSELVAGVAKNHDYVEITRNGEPAAVLMSFSEVEALRETIALLMDPEAVAEIAEAEKDVASGNVRSLEQVRASMERQRGTDA